MTRIWKGCLLALLIPYVVTLVWSGSIRGEQEPTVITSGKRILLDESQAGYIDAEEYLTGIVGMQIPPDYGTEALKAQAVAARTYIYKTMGDKSEVRESELGMNYPKKSKLEQLWGKESFADYNQRIQDAVNATTGTVMTYEEEEIDALFHRTSAGMTRAGDGSHPYLVQKDCSRDVEAPDYLSVTSISPEAFVEKIKTIDPKVELAVSQVPESIQLIQKDEAGYVEQIMIGSHTYTGEEVQKALGLSSGCFILEGYEGQIRAVCKGTGHGYGMSQYGAKIMAEEGYTWEDILNYYYDKIVLISS